ncbi:hypothetical protein EGT74_14130 [Chitinophaga lutea]|uniref:Uncharacterized protein n=1 Tax=Chitinophaga lutea TaxID=2488634 RepID=A0A3N4PKX0_9BACT|nr:hypothetical protein [Chitinophaga lutea]RPE08198.1 hypothetical protein EGT74_14130 [Chitinophaga lutea]
MERKIYGLQDALAILGETRNEIFNSIDNGFEDFLKIWQFINTLEGGPVSYKMRTKAGIVHEQIKKYAMNTLSGKAGIKVDEFRGIFGVQINEELFIRFKKMDDTYAVRNLQTSQHKTYMKQGFIEGFPNEPTLLFAGYIPDKAFSKIKGAYIACWIGSVLEWVDEAGNYRVEQMRLDFDSERADELFPAIEKRIKAKKGTHTGDKKTGTDGE